MPDQSINIPFEGPSNPWFRDPDLRRIFSGHNHGARCVAAIGPHDLSRVTFVATSNPRDKVARLSGSCDAPLIVHEALWFPLNRAKAVLEEIMALLVRANRQPVDGFATIPAALVRPLMLQGAEKAGVTGRWHDRFHADALDVETLKLRAQLAKIGVDPKMVATSRCV